MTTKFLRRADVESMTGVGKSTIYRWIHMGAFPAPVRLGLNSVGWRHDEVEAWMAARERVQLAPLAEAA